MLLSTSNARKLFSEASVRQTASLYNYILGWSCGLTAANRTFPGGACCAGNNSNKKGDSTCVHQGTALAQAHNQAYANHSQDMTLPHIKALSQDKGITAMGDLSVGDPRCRLDHDSILCKCTYRTHPQTQRHSCNAANLPETLQQYMPSSASGQKALSNAVSYKGHSVHSLIPTWNQEHAWMVSSAATGMSAMSCLLP